MLRFLVDEDLPRSTARVLREASYLAEDVRDVGLRGASDDQAYDYAQAQKAVLLTGDTDFANVIRFPPARHSGL